MESPRDSEGRLFLVFGRRLVSTCSAGFAVDAEVFQMRTSRWAVMVEVRQSFESNSVIC